MSKTSEEVGRELADKTFRELGVGKYGNLREKTGAYGRAPFKISALEKTQRQAQSTQGYKASAAWQTASLLRDLVELYLEIIPARQFRRKTQLEDAARSMVSTIEEGWARPTTREYLDYLGFSQASLTEVRGDVERLYTDGYLKSGKFEIPTPSLNYPYPPVNSRKYPTEYGKLRERLREFTGREIKASDLNFEIFTELVNKTDYLLKRTVEGLQSRIIKEEKRKLTQDLEAIYRKHW